MSVAMQGEGHWRRGPVITAVALATAAVVVGGLAIGSPGVTTSHGAVTNGGVWVTAAQQGLMGRLNVDVAELDARLTSTGDGVEILQSGYHVLETGPNGMVPINTATVTRQKAVSYLPGTRVALGGDRVVFVSPDGRVWILSLDEAAAFSPQAVEPIHQASGGPPTVTVSTRGTVFLLDGDQLLTFPFTPIAARTTGEDPITVSGVSTQEEMLQMTAVGESPVILDSENRQLRIGEEAVVHDLDEANLIPSVTAALQQPAPASEDVAVATEEALLLVPMDGGPAEKIDSGGTGEPAPPAQSKGCFYGAWSQSARYIRACEGSIPVVEAVDGADPLGTLVLRVNSGLVVLNDQELGPCWRIADDMTRIDDWAADQAILTGETGETGEIARAATDPEVGIPGASVVGLVDPSRPIGRPAP